MKPKKKVTFDRYVPKVHDNPEVFQGAKSEMVNHPSHYHGSSGIEVIDVIEAWGLDFSLGNALKYIARAGLKNDYVEDLEKARWYLMRAYDKETNARIREDILVAVDAVEQAKLVHSVTASK